MVINALLPPVESKAGPAVETALENINDTPMVETLQPHRLPVPRQTAIRLVSYGL